MHKVESFIEILVKGGYEENDLSRSSRTRPPTSTSKPRTSAVDEKAEADICREHRAREPDRDDRASLPERGCIAIAVVGQDRGHAPRDGCGTASMRSRDFGVVYVLDTFDYVRDNLFGKETGRPPPTSRTGPRRRHSATTRTTDIKCTKENEMAGEQVQKATMLHADGKFGAPADVRAGIQRRRERSPSSPGEGRVRPSVGRCRERRSPCLSNIRREGAARAWAPPTASSRAQLETSSLPGA